MELLHYFLKITPAIFYVAGGYVALLVVVYFIQEKFIFKPEKLPENFPPIGPW